MWLIVALSSYFLSAGVHVADKFLLSKKFHSSVVYAFYVGIWSVFNAVLLVIAPWIPNFNELLIDITAGFLFLVTLIFWYKALHQSEATRVIPIVGALTPIFSLLFSAIFLGETLTQKQFLAFLILISGGILISIKQTKLHLIDKVVRRVRYFLGVLFGEPHARHRPVRRMIINSLISAALFACFYVLMKYIYLTQPFIGGFVWSRLGTFIGTLLILLVSKWRFLIKKRHKETSTPANFAFFLSVRFLASIAFILFNLAISLGNVSLVNALQGTQYLFLIFLVLVISTKFPKILKEELGRGILLQKLIGIMLVSLGLYVLVQ